MKATTPSYLIYLSLITFGVFFFSMILFLIFRKGNIKSFRLKIGYAIINLTAPPSWDINKVHEELTIIFRKTLEVYPFMNKQFKSSIDFYEDFLYNLETKPVDYNIYNVKERSMAITQRVFQLVNLARSENPFSSIPPKEASLLQMVLTAINTNNQELGKSSLMQLVQQIEITTNDLSTQRRRNNVSYIMAIVGFILTIFFGVISFIAFLKSN